MDACGIVLGRNPLGQVRESARRDSLHEKRANDVHARHKLPGLVEEGIKALRVRIVSKFGSHLRVNSWIFNLYSTRDFPLSCCFL